MDGRWASSHFPSTLGASPPVSSALSAVPAVTCADTVELFCFEPNAVLLLAVGGQVHQTAEDQRSKKDRELVENVTKSTIIGNKLTWIKYDSQKDYFPANGENSHC